MNTIKRHLHKIIDTPYILWKHKLNAIPLTENTYRNADGRITYHTHIQEQIIDLEEALDVHREQIRQLADLLSQIKSSRSWKLTRPLRFAARLLRGQCNIDGKMRH